jgi:hypothetical protein
MTTQQDTTHGIAIPLIDRYFPLILLIVSAVSLPSAYLVYIDGDTHFLSAEWFLRELLTSLLVPVAANLTLTHLRILPIPVGILKSFLFYCGLWMVLALTRGGIFSYPEPFLTLVTSVSLLCAISCLYHYFYTPYLLLQYSLDEAMSRSKELVAQAPFRPFRFLITANLISACLRLFVKAIDPVLETALGITLDCIAGNSWIIITGILAASESLGEAERALPSDIKSKTGFIFRTILAPRGVFVLFAAALLLWQLTASIARSHPPAATIEILSSEVTTEAITLKIKASDSKLKLRGLYPSLFALAGDQKVLFKEIALVADFTADPPAQRVDFKIKPQQEAIINITFMKSPFSPELWRTPEDFKKLTDLTLWYGETKIGVVTFSDVIKKH